MVKLHSDKSQKNMMRMIRRCAFRRKLWI